MTTTASHSPSLIGKFRDSANLPQDLSAHDFESSGLLSLSARLGPTPSNHLSTISVEEILPMSMKLSPAVTAAVSEMLRAERTPVAPPAP